MSKSTIPTQIVYVNGQPYLTGGLGEGRLQITHEKARQKLLAGAELLPSEGHIPRKPAVNVPPEPEEEGIWNPLGNPEPEHNPDGSEKGISDPFAQNRTPDQIKADQEKQAGDARWRNQMHRTKSPRVRGDDESGIHNPLSREKPTK